jgi:hypothetical protein
MSESQIRESIKSKYNGDFPADFLNADSPQMRKALADTAIVNDKEWFKRIDHGEFLGDVIFKHINDMDGKNIKNQLDGISYWIDA